MKLNTKFERRCKMRSTIIATVMSIVIMVLLVTSESVYGQEGQEEEKIDGAIRMTSVVKAANHNTTPSDALSSETQPMQGMENLENEIYKVKFEEPVHTETSENYVPTRSTSVGIKMPEKNEEFKGGEFIALNDVNVYDFPSDGENVICMSAVKKGEVIKVNGLYGEYFQTEDYTYVKTSEFERYYKPLNKISTGETVETRSGASAKEINAILKDTGLEGLGNVVIEVENKYNINALFIVSVMRLESANGDSRLAKNKNNLFGIAAYDESPYSSAFHYSSKEECVRDFGRIIHKYYLGCDRETVNEINQKYSSSSSWAKQVVTLANECYEEISSNRSLSIQNDSKVVNGNIIE